MAEYQGKTRWFVATIWFISDVTQAQHNAVKAYDNRLLGPSKLQGKIARDHQRLQNPLG